MAQMITAAASQSGNPPLDPRAMIASTKWPSLVAPPSTPPRPLSDANTPPRSLLPPYVRSSTEYDAPRLPKYPVATGGERVAINRTLSSHRPPPGAQPIQARSRAFFDVVLADPLPPAPVQLLTPPREGPTEEPISPLRQCNLSNSKQLGCRKRGHKRKQPTPDESSEEEEDDDDDDDSEYDAGSTIDESSDEDEPALSRGGVLIMYGERKSRVEPDIPTSDMRGIIPDTSCEETRRLFETEFSTHKAHAAKRRARRGPVGPSTRPPKPKAEAVRKSSRLATRYTTPFDADSSVTDISVAGSTRSASVASTRNPPKPKARPSKSKTAPRPKTEFDHNQPTPQSTSMAHPSSDPPPPAPTNVVSLRPGYNAYTPEDKQWFLDFVEWVFRQNVHAGKAEICQDIFQQAPHHRLESWKSYWRDHISEVESLRNAARVNLTRQASHPRRTIVVSRSDDEASVMPRARTPTIRSDSSESADLSVRGSSKHTFYDSIKSGRRRTIASSRRVSSSQMGAGSVSRQGPTPLKRTPARDEWEETSVESYDDSTEKSPKLSKVCGDYKPQAYVVPPQSLAKRPRW